MMLSEFRIGREFTCGNDRWRCTDVGTRVVVAIRLNEATITRKSLDGPVVKRTISSAEAEEIGWFNGPPYNVAERVFDEDDQKGCAAA